jgi:DNA-binding GntR family transcriptional regulator
MRSSAEIADEILRRIQSGKYLPGDPLSQYELADEFKISRTPIREALRFLEARRAISLTSSGRAIVAVPSAKAVREAFQIRAELEGLAAQLATDWIDDEELALLSKHQLDYATTLRSRIRGDGGSEWVRHNRTFHDVITAASHNERLHELISELQSGIVTSTLSLASRMPSRLMEENIKQHEDIIGALKARSAVAAREAAVVHVSKTMELVLDWMSRR